MAALSGLAVVLCLLCPVSGGNIVDQIMPKFMARMKEVREILLPVPEDTLQEGLYHAGSYFIPLDSETELCRNHSSLMFESYLNFDMWALRMVDASSKMPSGVLDGHIMDLGSYDQCLSVEAPEKLFRGQMCVVETRGFLPEEINRLNPERPFLQTLRMDLMLTICVPSSCTAQDVKTHLNVALNSVNATAFISDNSCSSHVPIPLEPKEWFVIFLLVLILALVVLSTAYENSSMGSDKNALLCAFSLRTNGRQIISTKTTPAALTCLNGLRVLAMVWVITGHRMLQMLSFPNLRPKNILEYIDTIPLAPIENTQLAVEIFFLMSGILVTYGFLRYKMKGHKFNLLYFYVYRYCRLTPALAMLVLLYATIALRFTDGPLWRRYFELLNSSCRHNWWATLLYINNYYDPYNMLILFQCIQQSWYLSSDFQLYLFSPLLLIPLYKRPRMGLMLTGVFFVVTTAGSLWNAIVHDLKGGGAFTFDRRSEESLAKDYIITHWRAASFLIGVALGYVLFKLKQGELILKMSRAKLWAGWLISTFFILFSVFFVNVLQNPDYAPNEWVDIPYMVFHRHLFSMGFAWIILVCTLGHGGWLNQFLSWNALIPFARLTYGAFLVHILIQTIDTNSQRAPITCNHLHLWYHVAADFTLSYMASVLMYLTVEGPCGNIATWCFEGNKKPKEPKPLNQTELPVFKYTT